MRCAAYNEQMKQGVTAFETSTKSAQSALDSASVLLENRNLERKVEAQTQQLAELQSQLHSAKVAAMEDKSRHSANVMSLEESYASKWKEAEKVRKQEVEVMQAKIDSELLEKASLEKQLANERKGAQGLLMNFGGDQNEAQWKRKLTHLRAEHKDVQQQRDHYKRLCLSLETSKPSA